MDRFNLAVIGATGAVGKIFLSILEERNFPLNKLRVCASQKSLGKKITFGRKDLIVEPITDELLIDSQEKVGIDFFTKKMLNNENFTFVKYGDGEILCMIGGKGKNCDQHPYSEKLKKELEKSFVKLLRFYDDVYLAEWVDNLVKTRESYINVNGLKPKFADYECFLTLKENLNDKKLLKLIKQNNQHNK